MLKETKLQKIVRAANQLIELYGVNHEFSKGCISMAKIAAEDYNIVLELNEPSHYWYFKIPKDKLKDPG